MIEILRIADQPGFEAVGRIITHPKVWPGVRDVFNSDPSKFEIDAGRIRDGLLLGIVVDGDLAGFCLLHQVTSLAWQYHGAVLPEFRRRHWKHIGAELFGTIFNRLNIVKLQAFCPASNREGNAWNRSMGMQIEGAMECAHAYPDRGPEPVIVYGLSKEQWNASRTDGSRGRY